MKEIKTILAKIKKELEINIPNLNDFADIAIHRGSIEVVTYQFKAIISDNEEFDLIVEYYNDEEFCDSVDEFTPRTGYYLSFYEVINIISSLIKDHCVSKNIRKCESSR